ncbi:MAG: DUF2497 domain-containing protein [Acetobacteraceae bacterium]|nr:DUF2497 domain-containing protein [Acetobacteraceae bacterium]
MDDILASIRKILHDDASPGAALPEPPPAPEPLVLTEDMLVEEPAPPPPAPVAVTPAPPAPRAAEPPPEPAMPPSDSLVAPAAAAAAAAMLGQLTRAVTQERTAPVTRSGGPSIEDVVREEMRPLLKEWLDTHLPAIVERLVKAEIERVMSQR